MWLEVSLHCVGFVSFYFFNLWAVLWLRLEFKLQIGICRWGCELVNLAVRLQFIGRRVWGWSTFEMLEAFWELRVKYERSIRAKPELCLWIQFLCVKGEFLSLKSCSFHSLTSPGNPSDFDFFQRLRLARGHLSFKIVWKSFLILLTSLTVGS